MSPTLLRNLGIVLFALIAILIAIEMGGRDSAPERAGVLVPDLKASLNSVNRLSVERQGEPAVVIERQNGRWAVLARDGYTADVGKIREFLLSIADAQILEEKTANPERYSALGVRDPAKGESDGVRVTITGDEGMSHVVILGNENQGSNRYVRLADEATSLLVDKNPEVPDSPAGWLATALLDIGGDDVEMVSVRHADGEEIVLVKSSADDANFEVQDVPAGRELSYATVANGIGSVLSDLALEDARAAADEDVEPNVSTAFETFSGLRIVVDSYVESEEETWIAIRSSTLGGEETLSAEGGDEFDAAAAAAELNERLGGWQFQIPSYKANQLTRKWQDILKEE